MIQKKHTLFALVFVVLANASATTHTIQQYRLEWYHTQEKTLTQHLAVIIDYVLHMYKPMGFAYADRIQLSNAMSEKIRAFKQSHELNADELGVIKDVLDAVYNASIRYDSSSTCPYETFKNDMFELKEYLANSRILSAY